MAQVNNDAAKLVLDRAFAELCEHEGTICDEITEVLRGSLVTYRYILITGILAKATNPRIDPLSLQVKDTSPGAYDARSVCHKVIVPFERANLPGSLGSSNEPFLNKPARFVRMAPTNAVRPGNDKRLQLLVISALSQLETKEIAYACLRHALFVLNEIYEEIQEKFQVEENYHEDTLQRIFDFNLKLLENKCQGESCALVVGTMEQFARPEGFYVEIHKVNEAGTSSKEIGDIDILDDCGYNYTSIEVKDKNFTKEDVEHAVRKAREAGLANSLFVYGLDIEFDKRNVYNFVRNSGRYNHFCSVISVVDLLRIRMIELDSELSLTEYVNKMLKNAQEICAKEETISWIKECYNS